MKFLDRLASGLINPKRIKTFSKDKFGMVFLYFIFLFIIMIMPIIFSIVTTDYLDYSTQTQLKNILSSEDIPYEIVNGELTLIDNSKKKDYYRFEDSEYAIFFTELATLDYNQITQSNNNGNTRSTYLSFGENKINIIMGKDAIHISYSLLDFELGKYSDYEEFEGLDFSDSSINNSDLWEPLMLGYKKVLSNYVGVINTIYIIIYAISIIGNLIIFSLLATLISRIGYKLYSFKDNWKLVIYCMMGYVLGNFLSTLTGVSIFGFIGIVITLIYAFSLNRVGGMQDEL